MKKSLIFALTALLAVSFTFFGCPSNPSDGGGSDSEKENPDTPDTPSEIILFEVKTSYTDDAHCKKLTTKAELEKYTEKTLILKIKNTSTDSRTNWGIGELFFATSESNIYGTKTDEKIELTGPEFTDGIGTIELKVSEVIEKMADATILSINLYNDCELVNITVK